MFAATILCLRMLMKLLPRYIVFSCCLGVFLPVSVPAQENPSVEFPLLEGLERAVDFWKRIFTEFSATQLVFFDLNDPSKIYDVLEVGDGSRPREFIAAEKMRIAGEHGVDPETIKAQRGIKERFMSGLARSGQYIQQMQQIFREESLPVELVYLPLVESSFDIRAQSSAGALGMWQFIRSTGKRFLRIERHVDERRDPLESTRAAAKLLKANYELLGNWPLALTAYNYGEAGLLRAVEEIGSRNLVDLIRNYEHSYWGFASKNFYAEFLAAVDVAKNPKRYFPELEFHAPLTITEFVLEKATPLSGLLVSTGLSQERFFEMNPALSSSISVVPAGYRVKSLTTKSPEPIMVTKVTAPEPSLVRHRVRRGETLVHIARRYDASVDEIRQLNRLQRAALRAGQTLLVPKP
jgi:membrane-bound lytic murein transglycosylase D